MKKSNHWRFATMICVSVGVHGWIFFIFFKKENKKAQEILFKMEWHTEMKNAGKVDLKSLKKMSDSPHKKPLANKSVGLQSLLRTNWGQLSEDFQQEEVSQELSDVNIAAYGIEINLEKAFRDDLELPQLWKQIRWALRYRPEHALSRLEGTVQIRIRVNREGKLLRIFEEEATGRRELIGWTILCLIEAFREPFLKKPLDQPRTLDLRVQYTLGEQVESSQMKSARMLFVVEGDLYTGSDPKEENPTTKNHLQPMEHVMRLPLEIIFFKRSIKQIGETFKDKTLKNHLGWDYYTQRDYFRKQCHRHLNQQACAKLKEITKYTEY